jgi:nucleoside-diphosphate-sugar epimerase
MRVFVTGASGFIGIPVVKELVAAGHKVLGLVRSDEGAKAVASAGAEVHRGSLEDLDSLKSGAATADGVIHLAFVHDFTKFAENCEIDRRAIEAMGEVLAGTNRHLIATSGLAVKNAGGVATEEDPPSTDFPRSSERTAESLVKRGVQASTVRLPQVHDTRKQGLITHMIELSKEKGLVAYLGEGKNRYAAVHVSDAARLYRLALENNRAGARFHAVAEEGVPLRNIAETIGERLNLPVKSATPEEAANYYGWMMMFAGRDLTGSSKLTQKQLGWHPTGPDLISDLELLEVKTASPVR